MRTGKRVFLSFLWAALLSVYFATGLFPAQKPAKKLTYDQVYLNKGPQLLKPIPPLRGWLDSEHYLMPGTDEATKATVLYKVKAATGEKQIFLDYGLLKGKVPTGFPAAAHLGETADWSGLLYNYKDDLYFLQLKEGRLVQLTHDPDPEMNPRLSPDGRRVAFTRQNDLYTVSTADGKEVRLTFDGSDLIMNGYASWVYYEEILERESHYAAFWWAPDSQKIAFIRFDDGPVPEFPITAAEGQHGRLEGQRYPKAGDPNPKVRLGIAPAAGGQVVWADFDENADHYLAWPFWLPDSSRLAVQWMNRGQDNLKIYLVDPATGKKSELYDERQPAWVEFFEDLIFLKDGSGFLVRSDKSGWSHLYLYGLDGRLIKQLTSGDWAAREINAVNEKTKWVYFTAKKDPTTETHLYRVRLDGTNLEKLTRDPGTHRVQISPGGSFFLDIYSSLTSPARLDLDRGDGKLVRTLFETRSAELEEYALGRAELFSIPTSDGWSLPAEWILPPDFDPSRKYPILFLIYGGPSMLAPGWWNGRVANAFPSLVSFYLAQEGIIPIMVDHRGSGHHGKKGVALMHRHLGKWEINDWIEAVKWLRAKPFIDPAKVGISGGSYGGYSTCLALTAAADYFTHGFARSSVIDWRLYDSVYTERFMDTPAENKEGYEAGSVLTYAPQLKGILFIEHGEIDDNVHLQNSVQFIDRLMDLNKDFGFRLYPKQRHGFLGPKREYSNRRYIDFWFKQFLGR